MLVSKTDWVGDGGDTYETTLERDEGKAYHYTILQSTNGSGAVDPPNETVYLNRDQAIEIAKTILRNEGINIG